MIVGDPALRKLALMKLRGGFRRQLKRLKKPSGVIFAVIGVILSGLWISSLVMGRGALGGDLPEGDVLRSWTQLGVFIFILLTGMSAVTVRGIYLPKQEIERFFSAPITRGDLVRYRLMVDFARTLFGAIVLGLLTFQRMPVPVFGFVGAMVTVFTLGALRQLASLVLGDAHSRIGGFFTKKSLLGPRIIIGILVWILLMTLFMGSGYTERVLGGVNLLEQGSGWIMHPVAQALLAPLRPWAGMMTATSVPQFLGWFGLCLLILVILFELSARLPIDFRERSLETSRDISRRLNRLRRGGPISAGEVSRRAAGRRIPWLFGRGPGGAVAWIKTASIVRKARGTLFVALLIVVAVTIGVSVLLHGQGLEQDRNVAEVVGPILIGFLGIMYMSGALRFDFRADLDRMEQIKVWPTGARRVFVATLLPQVILISVALAGAVLVRAAVLGLFNPALVVIVLALPFVEFAWLAVENVVYLLAPVRFVPGQEGTLHHTGRSIVLFSLRMLLVVVTLGVVAIPAGVLFGVGPEAFGLTDGQAVGVSVGIGFVVLFGVDWMLASVGGRMLRRFDVARDRA